VQNSESIEAMIQRQCDVKFADWVTGRVPPQRLREPELTQMRPGDAFISTKVAKCPRSIYYSCGHNISRSSRRDTAILPDLEQASPKH
jgi:hypothetical protein